MSLTLHTSLGDVKCELHCEDVPVACENFLKLAASNYYDETKFLRNIAGFMIQGGDPTGTGKGGESIYGSPFADEIRPEFKHNKRGVISFANNGKDTNKSQFFIAYSAQAHLDGMYTVFGQVVDGWEVLDAMENIPVSGKKYRPVNDIILRSISIHANPLV